MPRVSAAFFATGTLFLLCGMFMGMYMGAHEDFRLAPVHAHVNLVGWVTMALYGTFYALTEKRLVKSLAWTNYVLAALGTLIMIPMLGGLLLTGKTTYVLPLVIGEVLVALGLLVFMVSVFRELFRKREV